ncbi:hypothetical protein BHE74_00029593, partial [Ensete ventricosum]
YTSPLSMLGICPAGSAKSLQFDFCHTHRSRGLSGGEEDEGLCFSRLEPAVGLPLLSEEEGFDSTPSSSRPPLLLRQIPLLPSHRYFHHPHLAFVLSYCLFYVCIFERVLKHFSFFFCQGSSNLSILTDIGARQAEKCRDALTDISFDICFSSPISRAKNIWSSELFRAIDVNNGGISVFTFNRRGEAILQSLNMTAHMYSNHIYHY